MKLVSIRPKSSKAWLGLYKLLLALMLLISIAAASSAEVTEGKATFDRGDYRRAKILFLSRTEISNAQSQYYLGTMYVSGQPTTLLT